MAMREIWHEVMIEAAPSAIYEALTDVRKLGQWWIPDTRGRSGQGEMLEFWFSEDACQLMQVSALEPDRLVRWRATDSDLSDWAGTEVEFRILPNFGRTRVHFRHSGYSDSTEGFPYYSMSWAVFLVSLKELLEKGKGRPFPNDWIGQ
ncbi:SRPBCC domain-containing protein [Mesorhizobium sp. BAC0120]|uniref:SRPBCC family protein n=1 Tax=Mesorhizobium sp. BAC0120 TaxID=3090670 RepID=UPI00298CECA9|nr:SRPBCC domain-containing protein [Mesorhizobium sp. BAC0120]MDW6024156.1 SRPBCC domain-containing protein [Mesorhizobium sp. BAC0120]